MKTILKILVAPVTTFLGACGLVDNATSPSRIEAIRTSTAPYEPQNCQQLQLTFNSLKAQEHQYGAEQQAKYDRAQTEKTTIGAPFYETDGSSATHLAETRGKINAVLSVADSKRCNLK